MLNAFGVLDLSKSVRDLFDLITYYYITVNKSIINYRKSAA